MSDIDYYKHYLRSLKKGFDKEEFSRHTEILSGIVDSEGLEYDEFHNLFKVWLNLSIPVTKWINVGVCLVPKESVQERTVEYALRWLLANYQNQTSFSRIGFVLDWLTVAMDCDFIDMQSLDSGYEVFYMLLTFEVLTPHAMKLVYNLTKPGNVTRRRVVELIDIAKKREAKRSKCRQLQVLLGLFKSYKPECVPESIPAFSIHTTFRKLNTKGLASLVDRFSRSQVQKNNMNVDKMSLNWVNPINMKGNKKAEPLVPNMEFANVGSKQYSDKGSQKNYLDFIEPASLLSYSIRHEMLRPARLRALFCNEAGLILLATFNAQTHEFLSHELHHVLHDCFLQPSQHSYEEKRDFLRRLSRFQRTVMQGIPVVTRFLAQYLACWNESDFFFEILELVEWLSVESPPHVSHILRPLERIYQRSEPLEQCAILKTLVTLHQNMAFTCNRGRQYFLRQESPQVYAQLMHTLGEFIMSICSKTMQVNPDDFRSPYWSAWCLERITRTCTLTSVEASSRGLCIPPPLLVAGLLLSVSAASLDKLAGIVLLYKQLVSKLKKSSTTNRKLEDQLWMLQAYTVDLISCLWSEKAFNERNSGLVFSKLPQTLVEKIKENMPNADSSFSLKSHIALAPYTYVQVESLDHRDTDNRLWFESVIDDEFSHISRFLKKTVPELKA